jgi:hypothetical protein
MHEGKAHPLKQLGSARLYLRRKPYAPYQILEA